MNLGQTYADWIEQRWEFYQGPAGDVRFWEDGKAANETLRGKFLNEVYGNYELNRELEGSNVPELRPWRFNLITNYTFREGPLDGVNVGGAWRWQDKVSLGFPSTADGDGNYHFDVDHPYKGESESDFDLWVGYERQLTNVIRWRIQLNMSNVGGDNELIPVSVQTDGTPAVYRIKEGMSWSLTNTFSF
jgi:hypothetical protein